MSTHRLQQHAEIIVVLGLTVGLLLIYTKPTPNYNFTLLADAFIHGRIWVDWPGPNIDAVQFGSHWYVIEGPAPALLALPIDALMGPAGWAQEILSLAMGAASVALYWLFFKRLGLARRERLWLIAFVFAGTDLWWCSIAGGVWFCSAVTANAFVAGALCEMSGRRRGWLIGSLAVAAVDTRMTLLPVLALYPYLMSIGAFAPKFGLRQAIKQYAGIVTLGCLGWVWYNEVRWGSISDIGYALFCAADTACKNGLFGIKYLGYELYAFFFRPPDILVTDQIMRYPYFRVSTEGVALTFCSPALVCAFWARRSRVTVALWLTTIAVALPSLLYYVNGYLQVGMRHALDFEPFLFVLMADALRDNGRRWFFLLVGISVAVSTWQIWFWWNFMDK